MSKPDGRSPFEVALKNYLSARQRLKGKALKECLKLADTYGERWRLFFAYITALQAGDSKGAMRHPLLDHLLEVTKTERQRQEIQFACLQYGHMDLALEVFELRLRYAKMAGDVEMLAVPVLQDAEGRIADYEKFFEAVFNRLSELRARSPAHHRVKSK